MKTKGRKSRPLDEKSGISVLPLHHNEPQYTSSHNIGKRRNLFRLPLGAYLTVSEDSPLNKKDVIRSHVTTPSERARFAPPTAYNLQLASEIYTIYLPTVKTPTVKMSLPHAVVNHAQYELAVIGKVADNTTWSSQIPFVVKDNYMVEVESDQSGSFAVVLVPKKEWFEVSINGTLYSAKDNRYVTARFPKKCADSDLRCFIQPTPVSDEKRELTNTLFPNHGVDIAHLTQIIEVCAVNAEEFRRSVTLKLPLPAGIDAETDNMDDLAVIQKTKRGWEIVDSAYKFTKSTVSFDVKTLSKFCVSCAQPGRRKRLASYMPFLEGRCVKEVREMLVFLSLEAKSWLLIIECVKPGEVESVKMQRIKYGFKLLHQSPAPVREETARLRVKASRVKTSQESMPVAASGILEVWEGEVITVEIGGDVKRVKGVENNLTLFMNLEANYQRYFFEPKTSDERELHGFIKLTLPDPSQNLGGNSRSLDQSRETLRAVETKEPVTRVTDPETEGTCYNYEFHVPQLSLREYFLVPEPVPQPEEDINPIEELFQQHQETIKPVKARVPTSESLARLSEPYKRMSQIEREPKVLSGRSLRCLASFIPEGLTLAVHLSLPDSTITGIGFDALASGRGMADVTYKILMYWKRVSRVKKEAAVEALVMAVSDMGYQTLGEAIMERFRGNRELDNESIRSFNCSQTNSVMV